MMIRTLMLAAVLSASPAVTADRTGTDMLFDREQIAAVETGTLIEYAHDRRFAEGIKVPSVEDGSITVTVFEKEGNRRSQVRLIDGKRKRVLDDFSGDRGNPVFVTFLESTLSSIAKATKGSPFYLRNRFKDAMATGGEVTEEEGRTRIAYLPFAKDRNREKLGAFADLRVEFVLDEETPGRFVELVAFTGDGETYHESVAFRGVNPAEE